MDAISKTSGSFSIRHPDPQKRLTHQLWHNFVEAPTAGENMYRFEVTTVDGTATLRLPSYFKHLNELPQAKVSPKDTTGRAYADFDDTLDTVTVRSTVDGSYNLLIFGTRKDPDALRHWQGVERLKFNSSNGVLHA